MFYLKIHSMESILLTLAIGLLSGYLGSLIMKGKGLGLILNLVVGLVGALLGGWVFGLLGVGGGGLLWQIISATIGAVILLWIVSLVRKK